MNNHQSPNSDQELLLRASQGDAEAFGDLYKRYLDQIYRYMFFRLPGAEDAEDLTEHVFTKVWEMLRDEENTTEIRNFRAWLYRVAHNQVVDYHRKKQPIAVDIQENAWLFGESDEDTEGTVEKHLDQQAMLAAINTLDEQSRDVIALRFIHGLSHKEAAEVLNLEPGHIRVIQHRALTRLREKVRVEDDE